MNALLTIMALIVCVVVVIMAPTEGPAALLVCIVVAAIPFFFLLRRGGERQFLLRLFLSALVIRVLIGTLIFSLQLQDFFGGDALTYDFFGYAQLKAWGGDRYYGSLATTFMGGAEGSGWGMVYLVAAIYGLVGRNLLAIQFINAVLGAATAVIIFLCASHVFNNSRVARLAAIAVAFYPSLVLWSSQGLKDGPIVFFLSLSILATLKLGEELSFRYLGILACSLIVLLSLRFYVFYMICVAIGGAFFIGMQRLTARTFIRQFVVLITLGLALTYFGVTRYANVQFGSYGNLQQIQSSRLDASTRAQSGFAKDVDVSTTEGALSAIPIGMLYLLFAPFPWQIVSLRQSITLPEMIVWWASFPMLILGLWFSIKYRLRQISPILIFTVMLSLAYSVFQGNVGTAYRQRAQLLVFYFIFVAVGYVLLLEKREEKQQRGLAEKEAMAARMATSGLPRN
jgi:4-amino-4-deoxy-L-arabinose transferase-like glycosyltransferase